MESKQEFKEHLEILITLLKKFENPMSVSYLNLQFAGTCKIKNSIDEEFMRLFKDQFIFSAIGDDIKIRLRNTEEPTIHEGGEKIETLIKIFEKNSRKIEEIKSALVSEMTLESFMKEHSTNKYAVNLPFILRNSDCLGLCLKGEETYVTLLDVKNRHEISEEEFYNFLNTKGLKMFVLERILNVFRKFKCSLNQGLLQSCFNFGNILIDKKFMKEHSEYFHKEGDTTFKLKEEYRSVSEQMKLNGIKESEPDNSISKNEKNSEDQKSAKEEPRDTLVAEIAIDNDTPVADVSEATPADNVECNSNLVNDESTFGDEKTYARRKENESDPSMSQNEKNSEVQKFTEEEPRDIFETKTAIDDHKPSADVSEATPGGNVEYYFSKDGDKSTLVGEDTDASYSSSGSEYEESDDAKNDEDRDEENEIRITAALNEKRSVIIIGENVDGSSLIVDLYAGNEKKKRKMLLKLRDLIDDEICK